MKEQLSKHQIQNRILESLQNHNKNWHHLYRDCQLQTYQERLLFMDALYELQIQQKVLQYARNKFCSFPENYTLGTIEKVDNHHCLIINNETVNYDEEKLKSYLPGDVVVVKNENKSDIHIERIVKRNISSLQKPLLEMLEKNPLTYQQIKQFANANHSKIQHHLLNLLNQLETEGKIYFENKKYYFFPTSKYTVAKIETTANNQFYYEYEHNKIYLSREEAEGLLQHDVVLIEKKTKHIKKIITRENSNAIFEVEMIDGIKQLKPVSFQGHENIKARIGSIDLKKLQIGDRIIASVSPNKTSEDYYEATYIDTIGNKNDPDIDLITIATSKGFHPHFDKNCEQEATSIPQEVANYELLNRYDFRNKHVFTIDCDTTKDMDDAVSIEILPNGNYLLGVHIANVSHYIKPGSYLYEEAKERSTSLYMLNTVIPMLPSIISNGICSLNPQVDRLTKSCLIEFDPTGKIVSYDIVNSVINSKIKMNYSTVNQILQNEEVPANYLPYVKDLKIMQQLSNIITLRNYQNGSLHFANTDVQAILDDDHKPIDFILNEQGTAGKIIENFMISANYCVAQYLNWLPGASINRIHEAPSEDEIEQAIQKITLLGYKVKNSKNIDPQYRLQGILKSFAGTKDFPIISKLCLTSMHRAEYSSENIGHFGLGISYYTHFTSPIRRFPDLRTHILLDQYQENSMLDLESLEKDINEICYHSSFMERQADAAEQQALVSKMMDYIDEHLQERYHGIITDINQDKLFVKTNNHIPGYVNYHDIALPMHYSPIHKMIVNEHNIPIFKVGHEVTLRSLNSDRQVLLANFALENNDTLEQQGNSYLKKRLQQNKF